MLIALIAALLLTLLHAGIGLGRHEFGSRSYPTLRQYRYLIALHVASRILCVIAPLITAGVFALYSWPFGELWVIAPFIVVFLAALIQAFLCLWIHGSITNNVEEQLALANVCIARALEGDRP